MVPSPLPCKKPTSFMSDIQGFGSGSGRIRCICHDPDSVFKFLWIRIWIKFLNFSGSGSGQYQTESETLRYPLHSHPARFPTPYCVIHSTPTRIPSPPYLILTICPGTLPSCPAFQYSFSFYLMPDTSNILTWYLSLRFILCDTSPF